MQLDTTYRSLNAEQSEEASRMIDKFSQRFVRLVEEPCSLRAVVDGTPEFRVHLSLTQPHTDLSSLSESHEIGTAISEACDKMKSQLVRHRHRGEAARHRL